ncbi:heme ABC exporter ATP-binding protein CcmA [Paracoccus sp. PAR01]|uniref:heme ABC exporter ATP-binding protein CcmA n=1 Tax=Paracoccus sp. PAR01 TaxID=2769282 RepID=UPI00177A7CDD|nr:heme ABC exporter ATP-binding protein CcmA [Paracoccus sp. PAR01]MBD9528229.1 heme ABC exporter ATP-binding protein CcmA [Paracoccus sp. PAR01]
MSLISVRGLAVARGGLRVIEGLDFELGAGQAIVLRGPNGAGKTTLLRCLAGLQPAVSGRIECQPDSIAYAGHADGLKPALTVTENLEFWSAVFGGPDIAPALAAMNLTDLAARPAHALSAGQKRRLGLARLMVTGRPVWLLDEPTVSLDQGSVTLFATMLRDHLAQGGAALIATHIDLGLPEAQVLDLGPYRARPGLRQDRPAGFNEAFA